MAHEDRRRALAQFLRSRRNRLTPSDVGIVAGSRRRAPGLRREEVAQLSGVSVTWYTWLEQARDITVSRQVLESLASTLKLDRAERRHLLWLGGEQPPTEPEPPVGVSPALQRLVDALDPNPAYVLNATWDLLAWNRSEAGLIGDPSARDDDERNIIWLVFTEPKLRELLVDWPAQARSLLAQYRADAERNIGDPRFDRLTAALREASAEFRSWWDSHDIRDFRAARRQFMHPRLGLLTVDYVKLAVVDAPSTKLFTALAADDATTRKLPRLAAQLPDILPATKGA
ncbi:helix-turn-helix transcriptional regulator [Streptomyces sp. ICBB 8177]|uniref:helix-turn-helix transcriptional regulator n=1 Tax=Streptomyces sp. ICBB 8177 TaxID=563922 RepID=UPI000D6732CC|nr:helix-turn-helix transcriptional regulator [Streptomyces sp. ICBB 8177]PWI43930.1 transcriptional regulator [Streptomyces sp. ICBB 8177]